MNENLQLGMESFIYKVNLFAFSGTTNIMHRYEILREVCIDVQPEQTRKSESRKYVFLIQANRM